MENYTENFLRQAEEIEVLSSIYGKEWKKELAGDDSYEIEIKKDLKLFVTFTPWYPLDGPLSYQLFAPCLGKEKKLCIKKAFDHICKKHMGSAIVYQLIEKLKEIVYSLKINDSSPLDFKINYQSNKIEKDYEIVHGPVIEDRKSTFQGHVCKIHDESDVRNVLNILRDTKKIKHAKHNISAYRLNKFNNGRIIQDYDDDGERLAGGRLLHLIQISKLENVLVVVTRWYGGIHLGSDRFRHIKNAGRSALQCAGFVN